MDSNILCTTFTHLLNDVCMYTVSNRFCLGLGGGEGAIVCNIVVLWPILYHPPHKPEMT